ncbi:6-phosphofructokinase [Dorcoceras hygrometricum]|uniref:6-phosphofructokinase n=1 Tax=Dorcoceras hygrometricum TaxID=472368 RepID=A0A2Z7C9Z4_9LAMI|nr:6-phosphofructokinase [Dorcoceras hygrometricum]
MRCLIQLLLLVDWDNSVSTDSVVLFIAVVFRQFPKVDRSVGRKGGSFGLPFGASFDTSFGSCSWLEIDREIAVFGTVFVCAGFGPDFSGICCRERNRFEVLATRQSSIQREMLTPKLKPAAEQRTDFSKKLRTPVATRFHSNANSGLQMSSNIKSNSQRIQRHQNHSNHLRRTASIDGNRSR